MSGLGGRPSEKPSDGFSDAPPTISPVRQPASGEAAATIRRGACGPVRPPAPTRLRLWKSAASAWFPRRPGVRCGFFRAARRRSLLQGWMDGGFVIVTELRR